MDDLVSLRPVRAGDEPFLLQVYGSTRTGELAQTNWTSEQKEAFIQMQFRAQKEYYEANYPGAEFQVILVRGEPAGRLYTHQTPDEIRVMDIALLPHSRRQGIGSWLLKRIQAQAAALQKRVGIHVEVFNPALRLYEALGFKKAADRGVYHYLVWGGSNPENDPTPSGS